MSAMRRVLSVSVDVDALALYRAIHGVAAGPADPADALDAAWAIGVPRFLALFADLGLPATFFVVGRDLAHPGAADVARRAVALGHELANHSHTHPYGLVRLDADARRAELHGADVALRTLTGTPVAGYRAPGYNQTPEVQAELAALGYTYDSSAFPCPPYVLAKSAIILAKRLRGRVSRSIVTRPLEAFGPRTPYRVTTPNGALWQLPMSVLPLLRFPLIGTSLTMLGETGVRALAPLYTPLDYLNIELHAVDLLGLVEDGLPADLAVQPDLRVPVATKRRTFRAFFERALRGRRALTLRDLAGTL